MAPFHGNPDSLDRATLDLLDRAFTDVWSHFRSKQARIFPWQARRRLCESVFAS